MNCSSAWLLCLCGFPGKNTGVGCHFLLQGIFPTQGLNLSLLVASGFFIAVREAPTCMYMHKHIYTEYTIAIILNNCYLFDQLKIRTIKVFTFIYSFSAFLFFLETWISNHERCWFVRCFFLSFDASGFCPLLI